MADLENEVRSRRMALGWSQDDLARRARLSRAGVSAIETGRLVPSTAAALALSGAMGCRVEDLFRLPGSAATRGDEWAWPPIRDPARYWRAEVAGRVLLYPTERTPLGLVSHDGVAKSGRAADSATTDPRMTLVIAGCDPAVGLLAAEVARGSDVRLIALTRSSRAALDLLGRGLVHAAGVHLSHDGNADGNATAARESLGAGFGLLRMARWEEGIASSPARRIASLADATRPRTLWIGREEGSAARQCLDEILEGRRPPTHLADDHRGVAEAIRMGWADAGICPRLVGEEAGLDFLGVRREAYDLCLPDSSRDDPRIRALLHAARSVSYRRLLRELPGYDDAETGTWIETR